MNSLYANDKLEFEKIAGTPVSEDSSEWPAETLQAIINEHPYLSSRVVDINFMQIDDSMGTGFGSAVISDGKEKFMIPIIIKNNEIEPLDTFIYNKNVYPLTASWASKIFAKNSGFKKTVPRTRPAHVPVVRNELAKAAEKKMSILDLVATMIREKEKVEFINEISTHPEIIASFVNNGKKDILTKIEDSEPVSFSDKVKALSAVLPKNMQIIMKSDVPLQYTVQSFLGGYIHKNVLSRKELEEELKNKDIANWQDIIAEADRNDFSIITSKGDSQRDLVLNYPGEIDSQYIKDQGVYTVVDASGRVLNGLLFPVVLDFTLQKSDNMLMYFKGYHAFQGQIAGQMSDAAAEVEYSDPKINDYGSFIIGDDVKVATVPFEIENIVRTKHNTIYNVEPGEGPGNLTLIVAPGINTIAKVEDGIDDPELGPLVGKTAYLIPESVSFLKLGPKVTLSRTPGELDKNSSYRISDYGVSSDPVESLKIAYSNGSFSMTGSMSADMPHSGAVTPEEAITNLVIIGITKEKALAILNVAKEKKIVEVNNLKQLQNLEKAASRIIDSMSKAWDPGLRVNLIKEASLLEDKKLAEDMISMYFITPENFQFYVELIPQLEIASQKLAKILLSSRLGLNSIPKDAVKKCIDSLDTMINKLNEAKLKIYGSTL